MLVEFIMCVISFGSTVLFFRDAPPTAPSQSTHLKNQVSALLIWVVQFRGIPRFGCLSRQHPVVLSPVAHNL
jgi:hypothetical protein